MSRFFVPPSSISGDEIVITGKEAHHIVDVMRLTVTDEVVVFDGTGAEYTGVIRRITTRAVIVGITGTRRPALPAQGTTTLIQALPKKDKMDYIVEKATELGVDTLIPIVTARTIPRWTGKKAEAHLARWRAIARESSKQCGRADIPAIGSVSDLAGALRDSERCGVKMIAALSPDAKPMKDVLRAAPHCGIAVAIGPEGDFTAGEIAQAVASGFSPVSLGRRVLKSDTAGLAALAVVGYELSR